jgi:hypothetical protein
LTAQQRGHLLSPVTETSRTTRSERRLLACGGAAALLVGHALVFDFVCDDAFISFRYADNLVRHGELVWNLGEKVEGYTNFLWTMVMAGVLALGLDPVPWSKMLGITCSLGTIAVVVRFGLRSCGGRGGASPWDTLPGWMLAAAPAYACWSTGGLETALFTLLATLAFTGYLRERADRARRPLSGVCFALAAMTRPEGVLLFGLTGCTASASCCWPSARGHLGATGSGERRSRRSSSPSSCGAGSTMDGRCPTPSTRRPVRAVCGVRAGATFVLGCATTRSGSCPSSSAI